MRFLRVANELMKPLKRLSNQGQWIQQILSSGFKRFQFYLVVRIGTFHLKGYSTLHRKSYFSSTQFPALTP